MKNTAKTKVLVAMSGGVDSSVAAALLKKQGFEVFGVYLRLTQNYTEKLQNDIENKTDEKSAREVAKKVGIKFKVVDARRVFKKTVVDYFLREYKSGRTPNPCAVCNPKIKFSTIIKLADKLGIEYVATGHYAKIYPHPLTPSPNGRGWIERKRNPGEGFKLFEALDKTKDQSYFLYGLSQKQLSRIIFPLGNYKKTEVRVIAGKIKLSVFNRRESHDVCFISGKAEEYLRKNLKLRKGKIVDKKRKILGEHQGLPLYTIGQRKGIELGGTGPYYVAEKNKAKNQLVVVSGNDNSKLFKRTTQIKDVNWIDKSSIFPAKVYARIRYGHPAICAIIKSRMNANKKANASEYSVVFKETQRAVTPGQSAVFYSKDGEVLGGGTIES